MCFWAVVTEMGQNPDEGCRRTPGPCCVGIAPLWAVGRIRREIGSLYFLENRTIVKYCSKYENDEAWGIGGCHRGLEPWFIAIPA